MYGGTFYGQTFWGDLPAASSGTVTTTKTQSGVARITAITTKTQSGISRITATTTRNQSGLSRVTATTTRTQTGVANIATLSTYPAPVFTSACNTSTDFTSVNGSGITVGNAGTGYLGKSIHIVPVASVEQSVRKTFNKLAAVHQFWIHTGTSDTISTSVDTPFFSGFADASYGTPIIQVRLIGVTGGYTLRMVDPSNSYATTVGTTVLTKGSWNRVVLSMTSTGYQLYVNNQTAAEATYTHTNSTVGLFAAAYGNWYMASGAYSGTIDIDEIYASNLTTGLSTLAQQASDAAAGFLQKYLAYDGAIVRPPTEGSTLTVAGPDIVSEGISYGLKLTVQNNDQPTFILIDNWARANLDRRNSTTGNTQNNAAPTTALNLMSFHYNPSNADGKGANTIYDANWAGDSDVERAQMLLWAHSRWGSSSYTVDTTNELASPNYKQRALNILSDLRSYALRSSSATGYNYLVSDSFQTSDPVQIAADYNNTAAYKLFAQYDSGNATTWNNAVSGAHDILTKSANQIFTGQSVTKYLTPDWVTFTLSTGLTSATTSSYGDSAYGYNAFRTYYRSYDTWNWYADTNALTALQLPKTFFTSYWGTNAKIDATFNHDGTSPAGYEKTFFYWAAYWTLYANDNSNTTAAAIKSGKLDSKYTQSPVGSYIDNPLYSYFDQAWSIVGTMQKAGTYLNYGQISSTTRTQTGIARIKATSTKTQSGIARITATTSRTQSGLSRITATTSRTQVGISRITTTSTKTQTGVANIAAASVTTTTRTQTGKSRISGTTTKTQTGVSRINVNTLRTQSGVSRIGLVSTKTQTGVSRITITTSRTQTGISRITSITGKTQTGATRITSSTTRTQSGVANIVAAGVFTRTKTQTGISRIIATTSRTQSGVSRITSTTTRTQAGVARIGLTSIKNQTGVARITLITARTQTGISRITGTTSKTQTGISRISATTLRTQTGVARIVLLSSKTQTGVSRLTSTTTRTQSGVARIASGVIVSTKTQTGVARILSTTTRTQAGVARIQITSTRTQTGVSRIGLVSTKTQTGVTRISSTTTRNQLGVANIFTGVTTRNQSGVARISGGITVTTRNQTGVANINNGLRVKTIWTPNAEYDASAKVYDSATVTYDSTTVTYDGADATLNKPKLTVWT